MGAYRINSPVFPKLPFDQLPHGEIHIGITGHRDLADEEAVAERLLEALDSIHQQVKEGRTIVLHTPLAAGADQLIYRVFCEWRKADRDLYTRVQLILPYPRERIPATPEYQLLRELIASGVEAKLTEQPPYEKDKAFDPVDHYPYIAPYLAEHCDIVIALWDGVRNAKRGGTGAITDHLVLAARDSSKKIRSLRWLAVARKAGAGQKPLPATAPIHHWNELVTRGNSNSLVERKSFREKLNSASRVGVLSSLILTILLGLIGHAKSEGLPSESVHEGAHWLFTSFGYLVGGFEESVEVSWAYTLSQFFAVIFLSLSAFKILGSFFGLFDWSTLWWSSRKPHSLVFGLGSRGRDLLLDSRDTGARVIAVDCAEDHSLKRICERLGIPLVVGDARSPESFSNLGIGEANFVFVCTGSDLINAEIAHQVAHVRLRSKNPKPVTCSVGMRSIDHFQAVRDSIPEKDGLDLRLFNREAVTVRMLLRRVPLDRFSDESIRSAQIVICGQSPFLDELLRQLICMAHFEVENEVRILRYCPDIDPEEACAAFTDRFPCYVPDGHLARGESIWSDDAGILPKIEFRELPQTLRGRVEAIESLEVAGCATTVFCGSTDAMTTAGIVADMAPSLSNLSEEREHDIQVWFHTLAESDELRFDLERNLDNRFPDLPIKAFSDFLGPCSQACAMSEELDVGARLLNAHYWGIDVKAFLEDDGDGDGDGDGDAKAARQREIDNAWAGIREHDRDSSRQATEHAFTKLRIRGRMKACDQDPKSVEGVHCLAQIEHRRWCAELLMKGFRPLTRIPSAVVGFQRNDDELEAIQKWFFRGGKKRMKEAKKHVDLVPFHDLEALFGDLTTTVKDKDGNKTEVSLSLEEQQKDHSQIDILDLITTPRSHSSGRESTE